ncbi:hypothetical protein B0H16DRAFT_1475566 [Mycena metata]|uniref:Uncharacterized protein n=1 Tax=Mycena metata TaxID=1033252 RepID=A0AAD7HEE5_9AGAR|nr:hypothetical protein B0H16DRAFT_1475566 [Mycena metata]
MNAAEDNPRVLGEPHSTDNSKREACTPNKKKLTENELGLKPGSNQQFVLGIEPFHIGVKRMHTIPPHTAQNWQPRCSFVQHSHYFRCGLWINSGGKFQVLEGKQLKDRTGQGKNHKRLTVSNQRRPDEDSSRSQTGAFQLFALTPYRSEVDAHQTTMCGGWKSLIIVLLLVIAKLIESLGSTKIYIIPDINRSGCQKKKKWVVYSMLSLQIKFELTRD